MTEHRNTEHRNGEEWIESPTVSGPSQEDRHAKREFITAYFEDLDKKIAFLVDLAQKGHGDEAWLLCLVYIDGLANWLNLPEKKSAKNFTRALVEHGGNDLFSIVLPNWLVKALPLGSAPKGLEAALTTSIAAFPANEAFLPTELLTRVRAGLSPALLTWLEREVWRGTIAHAVYASLRSPGVHYAGVSHGLSFSQSTFRGQPIPRVDFGNLYPALISLAAHAWEVSERTGQWFGVV